MEHLISKEMAKIAYEALDEKKAVDITIIDIQTNKSQVQALVDNVDEKLTKAGHLAKQVEGYQAANWILLDYGDVIVHVFDSENRLFYDLERIWRDGKTVTLEELERE